MKRKLDEGEYEKTNHLYLQNETFKIMIIFIIISIIIIIIILSCCVVYGQNEMSLIQKSSETKVQFRHVFVQIRISFSFVLVKINSRLYTNLYISIRITYSTV